MLRRQTAKVAFLFALVTSVAGLAGSAFAETVATPTFSPGSCNFNPSITVTISCATTGATIRFTTDGTEPTATSPIYTGPMTLTNTTTIKARGYKDGLTAGSLATGVYTRVAGTVATPTFDPAPPQTFTSTISVSIRCATTGATIRYTTDGTEPGPTSTVYSSPITLTATTTIKARGYKDGYTPGAYGAGTYTKVAGTVATPTFDPAPPQTFVGSLSVTIRCSTTGATIRYTTDGTEPTPTSSVYSSPLTLTATTTLKARAYKDTYTPSSVATGVYTSSSSGTVATPTFDPVPPKTFVGSVSVTIRCATTGATIRYTTDGTEPTSSSAVYTGPLTLTATTTLKARGYLSGETQSSIATGVYTRQ